MRVHNWITAFVLATLLGGCQPPIDTQNPTEATEANINVPSQSPPAQTPAPSMPPSPPPAVTLCTAHQTSCCTNQLTGLSNVESCNIDPGL
jgi:hypothetical protein